MPITPVSYTARPYVSSPTLGQLINLRGQHAAEAELRRGELAAQMWANLGQQISSGFQGYAKEKQEAPIRKQEAEARTIGLENARAEQRANAKATEDRSVLASAQGSGLEPEVVKSQLQQLGRADLVPIYEQTHANLETARLGLKEKQAAVKALENDYFGALAAGVKKAKLDPIAVDWALQQAEADGHDVTQIRQHLQQNPAALPQIIDTLIEQSPTQRKLIGEEADRALKTATETRTAADMVADNARAATQAGEVARHNRELERISALTAGRAAATAEETARHNRAMEENARNTKIGRPVIAGDAEDIAAIDEGLKLARGLNFKQGDTGILPSLGGAMPDAVTNATGFGVEAKKRQGVINLVKQIIGKGLEGGVLRKEDESKYEKILPTLSDHPDVVEAKVKNLIKTLDQKRGIRLDALEDAGYNVSKFRERQQDGSGVMVNMRAPNGATKQVPAEEVEHYKSLGAVVVGQ